MAITNNKLPWQHDINVFMTPIAQTNWITNTVDTNCIRNGIRVSTGAQNAETNYDLILAKGTWTVELLHTAQNNAGIYTVQLDGVTVGTIDGYSAPTTRNTRSSITGVVVAKTQKYRLKLLMATKNASSASYTGILQHIQLRRTA